MKRILVALASLALLATGCSNGGGSSAAAPVAPKPPSYSDAEWHWSEGWCAENLGGIDGAVDLWSESRPDGFPECVQTQLPRARAGLTEEREATSLGLAVPTASYCTSIQPPNVSENYDRSWRELDECMLDAFGIVTNFEDNGITSA